MYSNDEEQYQTIRRMIISRPSSNQPSLGEKSVCVHQAEFSSASCCDQETSPFAEENQQLQPTIMYVYDEVWKPGTSRSTHSPGPFEQ